MHRKKSLSLSTVHGYAAIKPGKTLKPFAFKTPKLGKYNVRIAVTHCGVCHSDVSAIDDYYGITVVTMGVKSLHSTSRRREHKI